MIRADAVRSVSALIIGFGRSLRAGDVTLERMAGVPNRPKAGSTRRTKLGPAPFSRLRRAVKGGSLFMLLVMIGSGASDWPALSPEEFRRLPELRVQIETENFSPALMNAAIFHETNRVRGELGLPPFVHLPLLDAAADLKAMIGVSQSELTHENPLPHLATPAERVRTVGLDFREVAENIARLGVFDLPAGSTQVAVRQRDGRTEFLHPGTNRVVGHQTYAAFAEAVVRSWMNSPGHRANIINPRLTSLGCATRPCRSPVAGHAQIYAVQVFFAPR